MHFTKMHGLGNDYLYVYGEPENPSELSIKLSERHFGAGSDGMIWISPSRVADFKMRIFNADGSEAMMCGNGIRCVGKYVYDKGYTDKKQLKIETLSGIRTLDLQVSSGKVKSVTVDMGKAVASEDLTLDIEGQSLTCTPVSVGNPHAVFFVEDIEKVELTKIGPKIERHEAFPDGVNAEFIQVLGDNELRMRVWERGSGETLACGTGTCATVVAAILNGLTKDAVDVELLGGSLHIEWDRDANLVYMTGPATVVYCGEIDI